jgi:hypothetical protein
MKFLNFFLLLWVIFALLDPDPDSEYGSGSESTDLIEFKRMISNLLKIFSPVLNLYVLSKER